MPLRGEEVLMTYDNVRATAPLDPTPDQLARAQEQRVLPVFPVKLNDPGIAHHR